MSTLDVSSYVSPTRFSALGGVFLARAVLQAAPKRKSKRVREALVDVRERAEALRAVARERMRHVPANLQPLDAALDSGWVGLRDAIDAKARLTGTPIGERAAKLRDRLLPEGTAFVRADFRDQWAASQLHLERVDEEELAADIDAIAGPEFLPFIRRAHAAFGDALGLGRDVPEPADTTAISDASSALALAIADYGRVLAGELERDDDDSVSTFRRAMAPLDAHRRATFARRSGEEPGDEPTTEPAMPDPVVLDEPLPPVEA